MPVDAWVRSRGGVAHSRPAHARGYSKHHIAAAVAGGSLVRVRRSWLLLPDVPADRRAALSIGGRLSCVSAAEARGWWVPAHPEVAHISLPASASGVARDGIPRLLHWARGPVPLPLTEPTEHPLNVLFHVARCLPQGDALCVWESAMRSGSVDATVLARVEWHSSRASAVASLAGSLSDSGIETAFVELMRGVGVVVRQQVWVDGHPLDGLIGERLAVQIDGFAHHQGRERRRDLRADARLVLRGYTPLRFDYQQVLFDPQHVVDTVLTAIAQGLHLAR